MLAAMAVIGAVPVAVALWLLGRIRRLRRCNAWLRSQLAASPDAGFGRLADASPNPGLPVEVAERLTRQGMLASDWHQALTVDQFELRYQPRTNLHGRVLGYEALLYWRHPRLGLLTPDQFLGVAASNGIIIDVERWALRQLCRQSHQLAGDAALPIAFSVSVQHWLAVDFVDQLDAILTLAGADPGLLEIALTETVISRDLDRSRQRMAQLSEKGVGFVLERFGTGWLSLPLLHALPLDRLKIDRFLVAGLEARSSAYTLIKSIIAMARPLGIPVLAEGVDTLEQVQILSALGCDQCQGHYFGDPVLLRQDRSQAFSNADGDQG